MQTKVKKAAYMRWYRKTHPDYQRVYQEAHREQLVLYYLAYRQVHPQRNRAYREAHREELHAYNHVYYEAHKEECKAKTCAYRENHREELEIYRKAHLQQKAERGRRRDARERGATIGKIDLEAIKLRDRMRCCICGKNVLQKDLSFDHTVPLSLGGSHSQENLRVAHFRCNSRRGAGRLPVQLVLV